MTLSTARAADTAAAVNELIEAGDPNAVANASEDVLIECARRYLTDAIASRERGKARGRERRAVDVDAVDRAILARMHAVAREYTDKTARWTVELMESTFVLDGERIRWGDASYQQHTERAEALELHAAGTIQTSVLHRQAADAIREAGAVTLREVVK
jgi:hypothetical protein